MILRHPGISPTNDLVAKKIFSNPEITCQFIRDMLDLPAKNVTILEGSNIHVLPTLPYSAQDFADVGLGQFVAELDVFRHFISGQLGTAEFDEFFFGQARIFFDDEDFESFACFFVGHADTGDFHDFIVV